MRTVRLRGRRRPALSASTIAALGSHQLRARGSKALAGVVGRTCVQGTGRRAGRGRGREQADAARRREKRNAHKARRRRRCGVRPRCPRTEQRDGHQHEHPTRARQMQPNCRTPPIRDLKRATGIEPALEAWKASVQPQHFARGEGIKLSAWAPRRSGSTVRVRRLREPLRAEPLTMARPKGSSTIGSAPVSKTGGCRFESCLPCFGSGCKRAGFGLWIGSASRPEAVSLTRLANNHAFVSAVLGRDSRSS